MPPGVTLIYYFVRISEQSVVFPSTTSTCSFLYMRGSLHFAVNAESLNTFQNQCHL